MHNIFIFLSNYFVHAPAHALPTTQGALSHAATPAAATPAQQQLLAPLPSSTLYTGYRARSRQTGRYETMLEAGHDSDDESVGSAGVNQCLHISYLHTMHSLRSFCRVHSNYHASILRTLTMHNFTYDQILHICLHNFHCTHA